MSEAVSIIFEDDNVLAIHKPPGVPFHSEDALQGIVELVRNKHGSKSLFPVHRLDKMTSGLMLFAKTPQVNSELSSLFSARKVEKYYLAFSASKPAKKQGLVKGGMAKSRRGSYKLTRSDSDLAVTRFKAKPILAKNVDINKPVWMFLIKPETGKTHQIRVALKSLGAPILGDARYAGKSASRGYLHAYCLRFILRQTHYELVDPLFWGTEIQLNQFGEDTKDFEEPFKLSWGKQAFTVEF